MKEQLESVVLQMYKAGMRCSEAVREFQKTFILAVLKDQRGNQCKAAKKLGIHRNTLRRTIQELEIDIVPTRATGRLDHRDRRFQRLRCDDGQLKVVVLREVVMPDPTWQALYRAALVESRSHQIERPHRSRPAVDWPAIGAVEDSDTRERQQLVGSHRKP